MYLVTGSTGFIGKYLVKELISKGKPIECVVRKNSQKKFNAIKKEFWSNSDLVKALVGDITKENFGLKSANISKLKKDTKHFFHVAAVYDLSMDKKTAIEANVQGTHYALSLANQLNATFQYTSSIVVAGDYKHNFREDMFDEGQKHKNPYGKSKFEAEKLVRKHCKVPYRIYRPGVVVGSAETGYAEKIDGPYFGFKIIQSIRGALPQWIPMLGLEGGKMHIVPVDYVAKSMFHIAHNKGLDGKAFHLTDPKPLSFGDTLNEFCKAAHAPQFSARLDSRMFNFLPRGMTQMLGSIPTVKSIKKQALASYGIPDEAMEYLNWRTTYDCRDTENALEGSGISCPSLPQYAWRIWDYWERYMDPDLFKDQSLNGKVKDKIIMLTGASSGIGKEAALKIAQAGGTIILVARSIDKLEETKKEVELAGGKAYTYSCDLSSEESCAQLVENVLKDIGRVDILINNAGRSIRRSISNSYDRFHDFQRTMQLNYFGSLKLILGFLPTMRKNKFGHVINISSIGVQANVPRFSAYVASKAALDAFSRSIAMEVVSDNVHLTTVYMPLVRTPMTAPTKIYESFPLDTPEQATALIVDAIIKRPKRVASRLGTFGEVLYAINPKMVDQILNIGFRLFPDTKPGSKKQKVSMEGIAFAHLMKGIHW